jgi:hypothetical protein
MTGAERLAKIREWLNCEVPERQLKGRTKPFQLGFQCGVDWAKDQVEDIYNAPCPLGQAQPDPHPLGSVRFDEATEEQFVEFWGATGFMPLDWEGRSKPLANGGRLKPMLSVEFGGLILYAMVGGAIPLPVRFATFQEALDALNELAATKIMGGWA